MLPSGNRKGPQWHSKYYSKQSKHTYKGLGSLLLKVAHFTCSVSGYFSGGSLHDSYHTQKTRFDRARDRGHKEENKVKVIF